MQPTTARRTGRLLTASVAGAQGFALLAYSISIAAVAVTSGLSGPEDVSSPSGTAVEVAVFALFGAGLGAIALGRFRGADWSTVPFVVAELLALTVGIPLATGSGVLVGIPLTLAAIAGIAALFVEKAAGAEVDLRSETSTRTVSSGIRGVKPR